MLRDQLPKLPNADTKYGVTQREMTEIFYLGASTATRLLRGANTYADLRKMVDDICDEIVAFQREGQTNTTDEARATAKKLLNQYGLAGARQRLRAIALDKGWFVTEASQYFGVDLTRFDSIDEVVMLTRTLRNRGIEPVVEVCEVASVTPQTHAVVEAVFPDGLTPGALNNLAKQFGNVKVIDKTTPRERNDDTEAIDAVFAKLVGANTDQQPQQPMCDDTRFTTPAAVEARRRQREDTPARG